MPKIKYQEFNFRKDTLNLIDTCDKILHTYWDAGWHGITLRQLYYQLVSKNIIRNEEKSYKLLSVTISNARLAGLIDWNHIVDRARYMRSTPTWDSPTEIIEGAASQFKMPYWEETEYSPEIWIEKEALIGVAERAGLKHRVPYYTCKGYNSQSQMWASAQRFTRVAASGRAPVIFYMGDHDPSGMDMSRDLWTRLTGLGAPRNLVIQRVALNIDQIQKYKPPPQPAKQMDSRYKEYVAENATKSCWELDALEPSILLKLLDTGIEEITDFDTLDEVQTQEDAHREALGLFATHYEKAVAFLNGLE